MTRDLPPPFYVLLQLALIACLLLTTRLVAVPAWAWACIFAAAAWLCWALLTLRVANLRISPLPRRGAPLVCRGPYRFSRHPMYTATLFGMAALVLGTASALRVGLWLLLALVLDLKARYEERLMQAEHADYSRYREITTRLVPLPRACVRPWRILCRGAVILAAIAFALQLFLCLLPVHAPLLGWLSMADADAPERVDVIVVLGGGGIPSGSGLLRTYHGATLAAAHPDAKVIVALPADGAIEGSMVWKMREELLRRGVAAERIALEGEGRNTAEQASRVRAMLGARATTARVAVVTSGLHLRRSIMVFHHVGVAHAHAAAAESVSVDADLGAGVGLRYGIWSRLGGQIEMTRELLAIAVYRLKGWI